MGRTKLEVDISALGRRSRSMHVIVGPTTTCTDVVQKILHKCRVSDPLAKYQLSVTSGGKEQLLRDEDRPSAIHASLKDSVTFHLRYRTSGLVRVYYGSEEAGDRHQTTFQSLIVTPSMTTRDVTQLAVARLFPQGKPEHFDLVVRRRGQGERVLAGDECPLYLQQQNIQLDLRRKHQQVHHPPTHEATPPTAAHANGPTPRPLFPAVAPANPDRPTQVELYRGKLGLYSELIAALKHFSGSSHAASGGASLQSRESVLEQALVEQNQIIDVMQELVSSLETENKFSSEKVRSQSGEILRLSEWEGRAKKAEDRLKDIGGGATMVGLTGAGNNSMKTGSEKSLVEDRLKSSQPHTLPAKSRGRVSSVGQRQESQAPSAALLASTRTKLESERVRVIELEEELSARREEVNHLKASLSEKRTVLISKESEVLHHRHEMTSLKQLHHQQQDVMMSLRTALMDKDVQLTSLTRALSKEKRIMETLRHSPRSAIPKGRIRPPHLYEQVLGRDIHALELKRQSGWEELGFSFGKVELPVSSRLSCVVVKSVKEGSIAYDILQPGDELLEANGYSFRSMDQDKAIEQLEKAVGHLRLVVARDSDLGPLHSTPLKSQRSSQFSDGSTSLWFTALQDLDASASTDSGSEKFASVFDGPPAVVRRFQLSAQGTTPTNTGGLEVTLTQELEAGHDGAPSRQLHSEDVAHLTEQLCESEAARVELESELEATCAALEELKMECDLTKAENYELQQQLDTSDTEMADVQHKVVELQDMLAQLQQQVANEQAQTAQMETMNRSLVEQLENLRKEYRSAHEEGMEAQRKVQRITSEGEVQVRELKEEVEMLKAQNQQLSSEIGHRQSIIEEVRQQFDSSKEEYEQSKAVMDTENRRLKGELQAVQESLVREKASSAEELEQLRSQLQTAKSLLLQAERKDSSMAVELSNTKQAADLSSEQLKKMAAEVRATRDELGKYKQVAETKTLEMETLTLGLKAAQNKLESNRSLVSRLQGEVDNLRRTNAHLQADKGKTELTRRKMDRAISNIETEKALLEERLLASEEEKDTLFQQLEESVEENVDLQQQLEDVQRKVTELQGAIEAARQREKRLEESVKELTTAKRSVEDRFVNETELLRAEKAVLTQEVNSARRDAASAIENRQSSSTESQHQLAHLHGELDRQKEAMLACERKRVYLEQECEGLRRDVAKNSQGIETLTGENESLTQTVGVLRRAQQEKEAELERQLREVDKLTKLGKNLQEKVRLLEEGRASHSKELTKSKEELDSLRETTQNQEQQMMEGQLELERVSRELEVKSQELTDSLASCQQAKEELVLENQKTEQLTSSVKQLQSQVEALQASKRQREDLLSSMEFVHQQDQSKLERIAESLRLKEEEVVSTREELGALQESSRTETQHLKAEQAALRESVAALRLQLKESDEERQREALFFGEKLRAAEQQLGAVKDKLQSQQSTNSINQATTSQLQASLKHAIEERYNTQQRLDDSTQQTEDLKAELCQVKEQLSRLQSDKSHVESTNVALSMESVTQKQQLRQARSELEELRPKLQVLEMNLDVAKRNLSESEEERSRTAEKSGQLELQLTDANRQVEQLENEKSKMMLDLNAKEELISQQGANLELRKGECHQLQGLLVTAKNTAVSQEEKIAALEAERTGMEESLRQMRISEEALKDSLETARQQRATELEEHERQNASSSEQIEELKRREKDHSEQVRKLEVAYAEQKSISEQLLAAQEALSKSLSTLGSEKEQEILQLSQQVVELETSVLQGQQELSEARQKESELQSKAQRQEEEGRMRKEEVEMLGREMEKLQEELEIHRATESQLSELHGKVSQLEEGLREKSERLRELTHSHSSMEAELTQTRAESKGLLEKVSELAGAKVSVAEMSTEAERLQGELANEMKARLALGSERDQLMSVLRRLEVEKHTAAVQQPSPKLSREASREQILAQLRDKEEEAFRLREYVGKLLTNVVEKAPFVLENMH